MQIHHRQPLLLNDDQVQAWLQDRLVEMTLPQPQIVFHPVSRRVGDARQDDPSLTAPVSLDAEKTGQTGDLFS
jgi:putative SOS response-associated peptidase YedK